MNNIPDQPDNGKFAAAKSGGVDTTSRHAQQSERWELKQMNKKFLHTVIGAMFFGVLSFSSSSAATLSSTLQSKLSSLSDVESVGVVIVAFQTNNGLDATHLDLLRSVGINGGKTLNQLGMVATPATVRQVRALSTNAKVRSIWSNERLEYFIDQARMLTGIDRIRTDAAFTLSNGGLPVGGQGNFSVVINDSGIDATHNDLRFGPKVIENVLIVTDTETDNQHSAQPSESTQFTSLVAVTGVPNTDTHVGHGTHCAGIAGGSGQQSGGRYAGVAPGVKLIGTGSGAGLFILNALGGFEWSLANQFLHNIRVISNSWGSSGPFIPDNPINIATFIAYQHNIVSVFAAGNSGPGWDTHNPYAKAPWVISVAAGTKEGGLVNFSSRGTPKEDRLANSDPNDDHDAPTIVAPGTGREFAANSGRFTSDIVSTRSSTNVVSNGADADLEIPTAFLPFYTQISGTSMACPHIAGVIALMLDADPLLNPDEIKQILRQTATRMPNFEEFQVGSGYVNAHAAVDKAFNRGKAYGSFVDPSFNTDLTTVWSGATNFTIFYVPQPPGPQSTNTNTHRFTVDSGKGMLNMIINFARSPATDEAGNSMGLLLNPPGCQTPQTDPTAPAPACAFSSGLALPVLNSPIRQVVVKNPVPGEWVAEIRGLRGLAAVPQVGSPVGIAIPEEVSGFYKTAVIAVEEPFDIQGHPAEQGIRTALANRRMDTFANNTFAPDALVTREDFARTLALNAPVRQLLAATPKFTDVSSDFRPFAEAVTARGSTLRDWDFTPHGLISASGSSFNPTAIVSRLVLAVALVRALGQDAQARALANSTVTSGGQPLIDNAQIPGELRGYVQIALDKGLLEAFPAEVREIAPGQFIALPGPRFEPNTTISRATLAIKVNIFVQRFITGT